MPRKKKVRNLKMEALAEHARNQIDLLDGCKRNIENLRVILGEIVYNEYVRQYDMQRGRLQRFYEDNRGRDDNNRLIPQVKVEKDNNGYSNDD